MNKKALTEADIRTKFITPALVGANGDKWDLMTQIREEVYFTKGRVIVRGKTVKRGEAKKADYILFYKPNIPLAVVEAKDNNHAVGAGMQQALDYAEILDVPFAYSSNGDAFLEHDRTVTTGAVTREIPARPVPHPGRALGALLRGQGVHRGSSRPSPLRTTTTTVPARRPATTSASPSTAPSRPSPAAQNRILLVMATGTGKTYTAFQIIWRLWKSGAKKRILFLVDRNILADQTKTNDFKPFGQAMTKITNRTVDKAFEIYLCLYQAVTGTEEEQNIYKQFSPDFFDLVIVDECHRGSAADDAAWRKVLEYFSSATQIGLTATPKETKDVSNIEYFGEPIYTYSLRQGIADGFLAPYKVVRIGLDKDLDGWRPEQGKTDKYGQDIEDREYNDSDFDRNLDPRKAHRRWSPPRSPSSSRPPTASPRPSSSARTSTTPSACVRPWSTPTRTWPPPTASTSCASPATTTRARPQLDNFIDPGVHLPGHRHHLAAHVHRRRCPDLPADRARQAHQLHDRVQADHRPRHPHQRGLRQALLHHHGLQAGHRALRRSGLRRRSRCRSTSPAPIEPPVPPDDDDRRQGKGRPAARATPIRSVANKTRLARASRATTSTTSRSASSPSASSTSTRTASSSPSRSGTTRARPCARPTPRSTTSSPPGTTPTASRSSSRSSPPKACSSTNSPSRSAATTTPSISSATSPSTSRR